MDETDDYILYHGTPGLQNYGLLADEKQIAACKSLGTSQCAAICMQHSANTISLGGCPEAVDVWTNDAVRKERLRRPDGPLAAFEI